MHTIRKASKPRCNFKSHVYASLEKEYSTPLVASLMCLETFHKQPDLPDLMLLRLIWNDVDQESLVLAAKLNCCSLMIQAVMLYVNECPLSTCISVRYGPVIRVGHTTQYLKTRNTNHFDSTCLLMQQDLYKVKLRHRFLRALRSSNHVVHLRGALIRPSWGPHP